MMMKKPLMSLKKTSGSEGQAMTYEDKLGAALDAVEREGRYRVFADLKRRVCKFPKADVMTPTEGRPITVWCSNDYLGMMGQHPNVLADSTGWGQHMRSPANPRSYSHLDTCPGVPSMVCIHGTHRRGRQD